MSAIVKYLCLISTDVNLDENEIIRIYGKRWDIEVFFKVCKSYLNLSKECNSLSYDAMTAHTAVVFTRYMMLSLESRESNDNWSLGEFFLYFSDEIPVGKKTAGGGTGEIQNRMKFYINENNGENHTGKADSITVGSRDRNKPITMDEVKILSAKNNLTLDDLYTYCNRQLGKGYSYYTFAYKGEDYTLDIYESDYGEIEGVRLVRQSDKLSIDIRNGNIDHLLSSEVSVWDYLSLQLPEGMKVGAYDRYMTGFGGSRIDNNVTAEEEEPATEWWAAYFAKEDAADIGYLIELRKDFFTREEAQKVIESVQFCERAFGNG